MSLSKEKRLYTIEDIYNLPEFIRVELFDGIIYPREDYVSLDIDEDVFTSKPTKDNPITYKISIVNDK